MAQSVFQFLHEALHPVSFVFLGVVQMKISLMQTRNLQRLLMLSCSAKNANYDRISWKREISFS